MGKYYIFGYGSLVSSADVARTLGRHPEFIYPITLNGWIREWGIVIDNAGAQHRSVRLADGTVVPGCIVVLNVRRPTAQERPTHPNGVLFEVTEAELLLMDARETHYDRHEVTQDITGGPPGVIYTYVGRDQHLLRPTIRKSVVIPADYSELVAQAFLGLDEAMHKTYLSSTLPSELALSVS